MAAASSTRGRRRSHQQQCAEHAVDHPHRHPPHDTVEVHGDQHGVRKLRELTAEDVDRWLVARAQTLSSSTVSSMKSILRRSIIRAQARDKVKRNVVLLCGTPTGQPGRPSRSLTLDQAHALVEHATGSTIGAYVLLALLVGARTEDLRALT